MRAHVIPAHESLLTPDAVGLDDFLVLVREQGEGQLEHLHKLVVGFHRIGADAKHDGALLLELGEMIAKGAGFLRAARGVVLGVKIEDDGLSLEISEGNLAAAVRRGGKRRGLVAFLQFQFRLFSHVVGVS